MRKITNTLNIITYLRLIGKKWVLWIFLALDIASFFLDVIMDFKVPIRIYLPLIIIGLLWASFKVFTEMQSSLMKLLPDDSKNLQIKPNLDISLMEGNEYSFALDKAKGYMEHFQDTERKSHNKEPNENENEMQVDNGDEKENEEFQIPRGVFTINFRIQNTVQLDLDILAINITEKQLTSSFQAWQFYFTSSVYSDSNSKTITFPKAIDRESILLCTSISGFNSSSSPYSNITSAQCAARLADITDKNPIELDIIITIEIRDKYGEIYNFENEFSISLLPLKDIYISYWQETQQTELIRLANKSK